jgi:hypothetical protein
MLRRDEVRLLALLGGLELASPLDGEPSKIEETGVSLKVTAWN